MAVSGKMNRYRAIGQSTAELNSVEYFSDE